MAAIKPTKPGTSKTPAPDTAQKDEPAVESRRTRTGYSNTNESRQTRTGYANTNESRQTRRIAVNANESRQTRGSTLGNHNISLARI